VNDRMPGAVKAAILERVGQPLQVDAIRFEDLGPTDVLVRTIASGLCHSDLEVMGGSLSAPLPIVLGHELAGIVEAIGPGVTTVRPGDHVVGSWMPNCGRCFYCVRDQPVLCSRTAATLGAGGLTDGRTRLRRGVATVSHFSGISSHAQYSILPEEGAIAIPSEMPLDRACLLGCAVSTGVGGAIRVARVGVGSSVAVVGCGAVGLSSIQGARLAGASIIVAIDRHPARLELAGRLGATHTVDTNAADPIERVRQWTHGRGVDHSIEAGGSEATMRIALEVARPGAVVVILGKVGVDKEISLRFGSLMGERWITRSSYGGVRPPRDFPLLARAYLDGRLQLDALIDRRIVFHEINDAFGQMARAEVVRVVLEPWREDMPLPGA
jgi:S-(hydroxymethyl)glutathione dehydrogenase/alcohol dehydrogenase